MYGPLEFDTIAFTWLSPIALVRSEGVMVSTMGAGGSTKGEPDVEDMSFNTSCVSAVTVPNYALACRSDAWVSGNSGFEGREYLACPMGINSIPGFTV